MSIPLAILWHQHQPYYKDLVTGELAMPWVRLHGVKDYYGMARLIQKVPGMKCTVNLVPSMVVQLLDYVEQDVKDPFLTRSEIPAADLSQDDIHFILDHFFMAQWDRMIRVHPRFAELLELRRLGRRDARAAAGDFAERDLRDLQVWFNLCWFHPVSFEESDVLRDLAAKGKEFSEDDKAAMLKVQREVLARVVPLHKELAQAGQLEITTTPFYHPILPLLCDMRSAHEAMPRTPMPAGYTPLAEDAEAHVAKAVVFHERIFGERPVGMWPSEGSVSPHILPILQRHGIQWIATDEKILSASIGTGLRGGFGKLERPDLLYRPWRVPAGDGEIKIVFRDHELSDLVGFQYQGWDGQAAAEDLLARVRRAGDKHPAGDETLVSIILDGENCWEHYPNQGVEFLTTFYQRLSSGQHGVHPVRVRDALYGRTPSKRFERLFSGSWINHDFYIWIGHGEDRKAWEYVFRVREDLVAETRKRGGKLPGELKEGEHPNDPALAHAWEELFIAEGSDWYWWYGDDHTSGNDDAFDRLFRTHLKNVYRFLDLDAPYFLDDPIAALGRAGRYALPSSTLHIDVDGRATSYFEWLGAGRYKPEKEGGVMTAAEPSPVRQIYFGYDAAHLCVRVDFHDAEREIQEAAAESHPASRPAGDSGAQPAAQPAALCACKALTLLFAEPHGVSLRIENGPPLKISHEGPWAEGKDDAQVAWDEIVEVRVPFRSLGLPRSQELAFYIEVAGPDGQEERLPRTSPLKFFIPGENADQQEWLV